MALAWPGALWGSTWVFPPPPPVCLVPQACRTIRHKASPSRADGNSAGLLSECWAGSGPTGNRLCQSPRPVDRGSSRSIGVRGRDPQIVLASLPGPGTEC